MMPTYHQKGQWVMMRQPERFHDMEWSNSSFRFTAFMTETQPEIYRAGAAPIWAALDLGEPDTEHSAPKKFQSTCTGKLSEDVVATLTLTPERVDLIFSAVATDPFAWASLSVSDDQAAVYVGKANSVVAVLPPVMRLAVGGIFAYEDKDQTVVHGAFRDLVSAFRPNTECRDVLIRSNRSQTSGTEPGLLVNRLVQWEMVQSRVLRIEGTAEALPGAEAFGIVATVDVNTDANRKTAIRPEVAPNLIKELWTAMHTRLAEGER
jgi:hypothetical protein